jgi:PAS domain S-box-containing protein
MVRPAAEYDEHNLPNSQTGTSARARSAERLSPEIAVGNRIGGPPRNWLWLILGVASVVVVAGSAGLGRVFPLVPAQWLLSHPVLLVGGTQGVLFCLVLHLVRGTREGTRQLRQLNRVLQVQMDAVERAQREVREEQSYTRSLIEASLDPLVTIAPDGKITDVNVATETVTGHSRQELIGTDFCDYFTDPVKARAGYQQVFREGGVHDYELEIRHRDGRITPVLYNASIYHDRAGAIAGVFASARDISERRHGEAALRQLAAIVEFSDDAIISKSLDGTIVTWNKAAERLYSYTADEAIGKNMSIIVPPELHEELDILLRRVGHGEYIEHHDTVRMRKDGSRVDVSVSLSPVKDSAGNTTGVSTIVRDITERKRIEAALRHSSLYTRSLIEASLDPLVTIAPDGRITDVNAATEAVTGCGRQELVGSDFSNYFTDPDQARAGYRHVFAEGQIQDYPLAIRHRSGRVTEVLFNASVFRNEVGEVEGVFASARDVTERKRLEEELLARQSYTRSLIEASLDPLVTIAPDGKITDVNAATEAVTGCSRQELVGTDFCDYFTDPEKARAGYQQVFREGGVHDYELEIRHRDGRITPVLYNASIYHNQSGKVEGVFASARDVTERKRLEEELRARQSYTRSLIEASLDPLVTIAADGRITDVNAATEAVTGRSRQELIGSDFSNYFTEPDRARAGYQKVFAEGLVEDYPLSIRHRSGRVTEVLYNASVFRNQAGDVEGVFAAARDITERKQLEDRVRQRTLELENSVAELEAFSYSVSHDLRAPLRSIDGFSQILLEDYRDKVDAEGQDSLRRIRNASQNMAQLIDALLQLSRVMRSDLRREPVDLSVLALSTAAMIQKADPARRVRLRVVNGLQADGDRRLLGVALQNLLQNAWKFTARNSEATIELGSTKKDSQIAYYVRDNGVGFDMTYADKLFTPFQRLHAREQFEGTGIGLATVQRIIKRHGGKVWAEGEVDKGATFYFSLG